MKKINNSTLADEGKPDFQEIASFLSSSLTKVPAKEIQRLKDSIFWVQYPGGDLVVQEGSLSSSLYIVYSGLVKIGKYSKKRKKRVLRFLGPQEWFGLEVLFLPEQRTNIQFARAVLDSELISIETSAFHDFITKYPHALYDLCMWFAREVAMLEFKLTRETSDGSLQNFAVLLLGLNEKYGEEVESGSEINLKLPRNTLSDLMGVSAETLRRLINQLKSSETISTKDNKITILNEEKLHELAGIQDFYLTIMGETL
ncbi:Crp/Fnr family transcriptional regulator [Candidatus Bipolaricaulota bacterium]|nr:Crp/Fnr family transcriptional regulator [Candidatus Bipolaricaulota bacterium]